MMPESNELLGQIFQQYGVVGLVIGFLILGPGFTYFRTRTIRVQAEMKAQELLNEFAQQERQRSERLEMRLTSTQQKLNTAEDEVSSLRLRLAMAQSDLDEMPKLKHRLRLLMRRVSELETAAKDKQSEIERLTEQLQQRQNDSERNTHRIHELEQVLTQGDGADVRTLP